jgi:hypothetical protein
MPRTNLFIMPDATHMSAPRKTVTKEKLRSFLMED